MRRHRVILRRLRPAVVGLLALAGVAGCVAKPDAALMRTVPAGEFAEARTHMLKQVRDRLPAGESAKECDECGKAIPEARREAVPGVRLCVACQEIVDEEQRINAGYNRRGSKDSQLR